MPRYTHFYLVKIEYLGYRYHGWQKQPDVKTLHEIIDKTLSFVLGEIVYKTMGTSRTDAMVSAQQSAFELFLLEPLQNQQEFLNSFNQNGPSDLRATEIIEVDNKFNVINSSKEKEYHYYFASGQKPHPYSAPFVFTHLKRLNIELMQEGAKLFMGTHNFKGFCVKPKPNTQFERTITKSEIVASDGLQASFFPENVYIYKVRSAGFMRNQVRLMMGQLIQLGLGNIGLENIQHSLKTGHREHSINSNAPASGLHLVGVEYDWKP